VVALDGYPSTSTSTSPVDGVSGALLTSVPALCSPQTHAEDCDWRGFYGPSPSPSPSPRLTAGKTPGQAVFKRGQKCQCPRPRFGDGFPRAQHARSGCRVASKGTHPTQPLPSHLQERLAATGQCKQCVGECVLAGLPVPLVLKCHAASRFLPCSPLPLALRPLPRPPSPWTPRLCLGVWGRGGWEVGLANSPLRFSRSLVGFLGFAFVFFGLECGKHDSASGVSPVPTTSMIHPLHLWSNDFMHDFLGG
jgi:hypothetical protein